MTIANKDLKIPAHDFIPLIKEVLNKGKPFRFKATGKSMSPIIKDGEIVTIYSALSGLSVGDIGVFHDHNKEQIIIHRVIKRLSNGYILKGDSTFADDGLVFPHQILGRVQKIESHAGIVRKESKLFRYGVTILNKFNFFCFLNRAKKIFIKQFAV